MLYRSVKHSVFFLGVSKEKKANGVCKFWVKKFVSVRFAEASLKADRIQAYL